MSAFCAAKTHCKHGHPFDGDNLRIRRDGTRICRKCVQVRKANAAGRPYRTREERSEINKSRKQLSLEEYWSRPGGWSGSSAHRRNKKRRVARAQKFVNELKNNPCVDCGQVLPPCAMDFDHLPGHEKRATISDLVSKGSIACIMIEVSKCELVCSNCHRVRTYDRARKTNAG